MPFESKQICMLMAFWNKKQEDRIDILECIHFAAYFIYLFVSTFRRNLLLSRVYATAVWMKESTTHMNAWRCGVSSSNIENHSQIFNFSIWRISYLFHFQKLTWMLSQNYRMNTWTHQFNQIGFDKWTERRTYIVV